MPNIFGIEPGAILLGLMFQAFSLKFWGIFWEYLGAMPQDLVLQAFSLLGGRKPERLRHYNLRHRLKTWKSMQRA